MKIHLRFRTRLTELCWESVLFFSFYSVTAMIYIVAYGNKLNRSPRRSQRLPDSPPTTTAARPRGANYASNFFFRAAVFFPVDRFRRTPYESACDPGCREI